MISDQMRKTYESNRIHLLIVISSFLALLTAMTIEIVGPAHEDSSLGAYETLRAQNIERNNAKLLALGLISTLEEKRSNDLAWKRRTNNNDEEKEVGTDNENEEYQPNEDSGSDEDKECVAIGRPLGVKGTKRKRNPRKILPVLVPQDPERKSRRLQGKAPDGSKLRKGEGKRNKTTQEIHQEQEALVEECREARQRAALEVAKAGVKVAAKENPTATYEHCLMRVRTMTEKRLASRVKVIERAAGKHCVVKMAIFKSCLQDEGMWDLAKYASEALERLKALLPPPVPNEA